jgi:hypothetical protein
VSLSNSDKRRTGRESPLPLRNKEEGQGYKYKCREIRRGQGKKEVFSGWLGFLHELRGEKRPANTSGSLKRGTEVCKSGWNGGRGIEIEGHV